MKTFYLKNKENEIINRFQTDSLEESIEYFSKIKDLDKNELLEIYKVDSDENRDINR